MFGIKSKKEKELERLIKEIKVLIKEIKTGAITGKNQDKETKTQNIVTTEKVGYTRRKSGVYVYFENNVDNFKLILKPKEQQKVDERSKTFCIGVRSFTVTVLVNLIKKGVSVSRIANLLGVSENTVKKYCYVVAELGYFTRTYEGNGVGKPSPKYAVNMSYFDIVK